MNRGGGLEGIQGIQGPIEPYATQFYRAVLLGFRGFRAPRDVKLRVDIRFELRGRGRLKKAPSWTTWFQVGLGFRGLGFGV